MLLAPLSTSPSPPVLPCLVCTDVASGTMVMIDGTLGTVTSLHSDPSDNLLSQALRDFPERSPPRQLALPAHCPGGPFLKDLPKRIPPPLKRMAPLPPQMESDLRQVLG